jgi:c-di-GMP-binding flagellar brake protein YcgR
MKSSNSVAERKYMLPFGAAVALTLSRPDGDVSLAGTVRCLLGGGRIAVQLEDPSQFPLLAENQSLVIHYVRPGEAKYVGTTSVWTLDDEHAIVMLTAPETTGRRQDRRFVRVSHPVRVRVTVLGDDDTGVWSGTARANDVSAGGLCIALPADLKMGTRLHCRFELPGRNAQVVVETLAVVVRNSDNTYGVEFTALHRSVEQQLVAAVSWLQLKPRVGV